MKHRVNHSFSSELDMILPAQVIDTLIMMGHATNGVIPSTVRYGADADYRLIVVERLRRPGNWGAPTFEA